MSKTTDPRLAGGRLTVDLDALAANYRLLAERSGPAETAAAVKGDAYGLGADRVVPALARAGCRSFFVALPEEGLRARAVAPEARIFVLNGLFAEALPAYEEAALTPVLGSPEELALWARHNHGRDRPRPAAIHVDTGMNRLGLTTEDALAFAADKAFRNVVNPVLVMSHLACADERDHPKNEEQRESFQTVRAAFADIDSSLANSAGIFLGSDFRFDLTRPGIALYGGAVASGEPSPMRPVATLETRIIQLREAKAGETVGYGATVTLDRDTRIAVVSAGYADGLHRALSGSGVPLRQAVGKGGVGFIAGRRVPILGRISMDLTAFDVTDLRPDAVHPGDFIELFGTNIPVDEAAAAAGTIAYEMLTSLGRRYARRYVNADGDSG